MNCTCVNRSEGHVGHEGVGFAPGYVAGHVYHGASALGILLSLVDVGSVFTAYAIFPSVEGAELPHRAKRCSSEQSTSPFVQESRCGQKVREDYTISNLPLCCPQQLGAEFPILKCLARC
eukprot:1144524-Pelagomonas_calceolata.AAC.4